MKVKGLIKELEKMDKAGLGEIKENKMKIRIENGTEVMVNRITDYIANDGEQYSLAWDDAHGIAYRIVGRDASGAIWARDDN